MPDDPSTMRSRTIDADARTAWLLATTRSCPIDPASASRSSFVERLRAHGVDADPSRVSRWESGAAGGAGEGGARLRARLGVPQGVLLAAQRGLVRTSDPRTPAPETDPVLADADTPLDELVSTSRAGHRPGSRR